MRILANLNVVGTLDLDSVANAGVDTDRFLVQDSNGVVRYRTGAEVASDIGASNLTASVLKHQVKLGEAIAKGQAVYVSSSDGTNMVVSKASNISESTSSKTLGLLETGGALNAQVNVITEGLLAGLDTSTAVAGDPVWLGTNGNLIFGLANKPYAPAHLVFVGIVTRVQQNNGEIFIKPQNGFELKEIHDVQITSAPNNNDVLSYETSSSLYKMKSIPTLLGYTPASNAVTLTINGTPYDLSTNRTWSVGTVTSVGLSAPTGFSVGSGPITSSGTIALSFASGYSLPTIISQSNWDIAYSNRITTLTTTGTSGAATLVSNVLNIPNYTLAGLGGVSGSGTTNTLPKFGSSTGLTDSIIREVSGSRLLIGTGTVDDTTSIIQTNGEIRAVHLTLSGAVSNNTNLWIKSVTGFLGQIIYMNNSNMTFALRDSATYWDVYSYVAGNTGQKLIVYANGTVKLPGYTSNGFLKTSASDGTLVVDTNTYLTGNQSITLSGDATGSGTTSIAVTLSNSGVTAGTYRSVTVDAKGRITAGTNPTTISGYGITDAYTKTEINNFFSGTTAITGYNKSNWDTAYGWGNHASAGYATTTYVNTQISNLVASAPATLDTLNELAAALGNDANFSTTISTALGNRLRVDTAAQGLTGTQQSNGRTNLGLGSLATLSSIGNSYITDLAWSKITGAPSFLTAEADTLSTVVARGNTTSTYISVDYIITTNNGNGTNVRIGDDFWMGDVNLANTVRFMGVQNNANAYIIFGNGDTTALGRAGTGALTYGGNTVYHSGNLTNLNQLTNGPGYITGNQNITLSGDVTGSGATSIVTTIANNAITTAKINNGAVTAAKLATFGAGEGFYWAANTDGASILFESTGDGASGGRALSNLVIALSDNGDEGLKVTSAGTELFYVNTNQLQYKGNNIWTSANLTNLNQLTNGPGYITSSGSITGSAGSLSDDSGYIRTRGGGTEANIDTYTDNGVRSIAFTGYSQHLLSWNVGGSPGTIQQMFHYNTPANGWRIRNKTDNNTWSSWGYVVMTSANQGLISGTIATQSWVQSQGYVTGSYIPVSANTNATGWISFSASTQGTPIIKAIQQDTSAGYYLFQGVTGSTEVYRVDRGGSAYFGGTIQTDGNIYISNNGGRLYFDRPNGATVGAVGWHTNDYFYLGGHPDYGPTAGNTVRVYGFGSDLSLGNANAGDVITINNSGTINTNYPIVSSGGSGTIATLVLNRNIATPSNYYNGLQLEVRATSGTAGIGLHRNGYSHVGIYHDSNNELKFNMNGGTVILSASAGTLWGSGNLTNLNQLTNGPGYITGYTETDTLATVVSRGSLTTNTINVAETTGGGFMFRTNSSWGGWARHGFSFGNGSGTVMKAFGAYGGSGTSLSYMYLGTDYLTNTLRIFDDYVYIPGLDLAISNANSSHSRGNYFRGSSSHLVIGTGGTLYLNYGNTSGETRIDGTTYINNAIALHANNYNSYSPTLTGGGASGTWGISITGNAATLGGYGPNQTGGAYTIVQRDANGYIQNSYFYMSGGGSERNSSGLGYIAGFNSSDYYVRSYNSTAVASFLGLGSMAYASTSSYATRQDGNRYTTNFNSILSSGFFNGEGTPSNAPNAYGQLIVAKGIDTGLQIAGGYNSGNLWFRGWGYGPEADGFYAWRRLLNTGADPYAADMNQYVKTTSSPTFSSNIYVSADGSSGYVASRIWLYSHNNYRGAGVYMSGTGNTWFAGTPYTDFAGTYVISRTSTAGDDSAAQVGYRVWQINSSGNMFMSGNRFDMGAAEGQITFKDSANVWTGTVGFSGNTGTLSFPGRNVTITAGYNGTIELNNGASGYNSGSVNIPWGSLNVSNNNITTGGYLYTHYSIRVGEIWSLGGLYRSSGDMLFGTESSADWWFRSGNTTRVRIAGGDGNIWMSWAGDWLSNLLSAKQTKVYQGQSAGDWQNFTNDVGEFRVDEVLNITSGAHSNYPPNVYTYGGVLSWRLNNHSFQLYASHTGDLTFKTQWGNDNYSGWRRILHESNYNSWVPTLTGGGASGTWGISITGNAATATSATSASYATYLTSSNYIQRSGTSGNYNTDFSNTPAGSVRHQGDDANVTNSPGGTWWFVDNYRHSNGSNIWGTQIAWGWEDNANRLAQRNVTGGSWSGWVYYLNSGNYNSYAPTLTGGGASGTWSINITGNSNYATSSGTASNANALGGLSSASYMKDDGWNNYPGQDANTQGTMYSDFTYSNNAPWTGELIRFGASGYSLQLNSQYQGTGLSFRSRNGDNGTWNSWSTVIHSNNIGSQSVSYASSAGNADTVDGIHGTSFVRNDTTSQYLKPYYEYGSYLTSETPLTLVNQMGGGGLRVDFMYPSYTGSGNWNHVITFSGYNGYNMYQIGGNYDGGTGTDLWVRSEANHGRSSWTAWRRLLNTSSDPYAANMNQYVRTSDGVTFASVTSGGAITGWDVYTQGGWFRNHSNNNGIYWSNTGWHLYPADSSDFYMRSGNNDASIRFLRSDGTTMSYLHTDSGYTMGFLTNTRNWRFYVTNSGAMQAFGPIRRNSHLSGWLEGSYNNVGSNDAKSNPIYTIGSSYNPTESSLSNMYGVGYSHPNFWGSGKVGGWGLYVASNGVIDAVIGGDGASTSIWAKTDIVAYSDARVKENVQVVENALEKIQAIRGVTFTRNDVKDTTKRSAGVIAQEVLPVFPEVVTGSEEHMYSVAYGNMAALFIEAIKEQQKQIEELKAQINGTSK